jgi:hypothetical protein
MVALSSRFRTPLALAAAFLFCGASCSSNPADELEPLGVVRQALPRAFAVGKLGALASLEAKGIIAVNSLPPEALYNGSASLAALNILVQGELSTARITASGIRTTVPGEELLRYAARCALDPAVTAVPGDGSFNGQLRLVHDWPTRTTGLSPEEKRWLSACLLAHANAYRREVHILLTGDHVELQPPPGAPLDTYAVQEAAFYGDLFAINGPRLHACVGTDPQVDCSGAVPFDFVLHGRMCGGRGIAGGICGFSVVGNCFDLGSPPLDACGPAPYYKRCSTTPISPAPGGGFPPDDGINVFKEVITVHLYDMAAFHRVYHPECSAPMSQGRCVEDLCDPGPPSLPLSIKCHSCAARICSVDPYCCNVDWDWICVDEVESVCETPCGPCQHSVCEAGPPLDVDTCAGSGEEPWIEAVCAADSVCCTDVWDGLCVALAEDAGAPCPP